MNLVFFLLQKPARYVANPLTNAWDPPVKNFRPEWPHNHDNIGINVSILIYNIILIINDNSVIPFVIYLDKTVAVPNLTNLAGNLKAGMQRN